jgi:hypothetical protein
MNAFVVSGLVKRRAELAGEIPAGGNACVTALLMSRE